MAIKLRPYSETIKENMSKEDLIGWIGELEAEIEKLFGGYRMILNSTDIEMCDGDFARTIAKQMIDEAKP